MSRAIFIMGEICSGKDTFVKTNYPSSYKQIDLGELVRKRYKTKERVFDHNLEDYFLEEINRIKEESDKDCVFLITGIRQATLVKRITKLFQRVEYIYLVVPRKILSERFKNRAAEKDRKTSFEDALLGDESLGMAYLQLYLLREVECKFINNY